MKKRQPECNPTDQCPLVKMKLVNEESETKVKMKVAGN